MAIPKEFLRSDKIRGICSIRNLKTDEIYLFPTEDAVASYKKERFQLDLGMHGCKSLQKAYTDLGLELFIIEIDKEADENEDLSLLLEERKGHYKALGFRFYA